MPRPLGSLKIPTYWMRVCCDSVTPVQPTPVMDCSMPCSASTPAHTANTAITARTRSRVSTALASSTNARTTGANLVSCTSAPPVQPLTTFDSISTTRKSGSSRYCGAAKDLRGDISQATAASTSTIGCQASPGESSDAG